MIDYPTRSKVIITLRKDGFDFDNDVNSVGQVTDYPNLSIFMERNCLHCNKNCDLLSIEFFSCVLKKLSAREDTENIQHVSEEIQKGC
jgi:hypothetical protein